MRIDLPENFRIAMTQEHRQPIQLMHVHFAAGTVYLSDTAITLGEINYYPIVESWGYLNTVGAENAVSATLEMAVTIWNGGDNRFSNNFLAESPVNVFVEVFQTFQGLLPEEMVLLGEFVIQDPLEFSEAAALLVLELVSTNMRYFGQVGELLTRQKYPDALATDVNKSIDLIVGEPGRVPTLCSQLPPNATQSGTVLTNNNITLKTHEDLGSFDAWGFLTIQLETLYYNSKTANSFNITARGVDKSPITDHPDGSIITQAKQPIRYIVGQGPLSSISNVWAGPELLDTDIYTFNLGNENNPAYIEFQQQPTYSEYSKAASQILEAFDKIVTAGTYRSTCLSPDLAIDEDKTTTGAILTLGGQERLTILQETELLDKGEIINIFLGVTHWPTKYYKNNRCEIWVFGLVSGQEKTLIGFLDIPSAQDIIDLGGEVDLFHGHDHGTGGGHGHTGTDPEIGITEPITNNETGHLHPVDAVVSLLTTSTPPNISVDYYSATAATGSKTLEWWFTFYGCEPYVIGTSVTFTLTRQFNYSNNYPILIEVKGEDESWQVLYESTANDTWQMGSGDKTYTVSIGEWDKRPAVSQNRTFQVRIRHYTESGSPVAYIYRIDSIQLTTQSYTDDTDVKPSKVETNTTTSGTIGNFTGPSTTIKDKDNDVVDIGDFTGDERPEHIPDTTRTELDVTVSDNAHRTVRQRFSLTPYVENFTWNWFQNRQVMALFIANNAADEGASVVITDINIEVEYRARSIESTHEITCEVVGDASYVNPRPDAVVQHLLNKRAGLPPEKFSSVYRNVPKWDDTDCWGTDPGGGCQPSNWENETIWKDYSQVEGTPAGALFEEAAAYYAYHPYMQINGVIPGNMTVKDAIEKVTWQSRSSLLWQHGKAQLVIKRKSSDWIIAKTMQLDDIQLKSYKYQTTRVDQINNKIDLFHTIDRLSDYQGSGQYDETAFIEDLNSQKKHGVRVKDDNWLFDLCRNQEMADDLADYYLWQMGQTSSLYSFTTYLKNFNLEKDDYIRLNSYRFGNLVNLPVIVREIKRIFGSGKTSQMNLLEFIVESIRQLIYSHTQKDIVNITDDLQIFFLDNFDLADSVFLQDVLTVVFNKEFLESVTATDVLNIIATYKPLIQDNVTLTDELTSHMELVFNDNVSIVDDLQIAEELCFGTCGFGAPSPDCRIPFGSITVYQGYQPDTLSINDLLTFLMIPAAIEESINCNDNLSLSDGFGSPLLGDGFGHIPMGH